MNSTCAICHDPTDTETCSRDCAIDLAFATGRITDYPEETRMDTQETVTLPPMTDAERQAYIVITGITTHPHELGIHCLSCRQAATNIIDAIAPTIRNEERLAVHKDLVARHEAYEAHPDLYERLRAVRRLTPREHSEHMVWELGQRRDLYRLPDSYIGALPAGYVEAS